MRVPESAARRVQYPLDFNPRGMRETAPPAVKSAVLKAVHSGIRTVLSVVSGDRSVWSKNGVCLCGLKIKQPNYFIVYGKYTLLI